MDRSVEMERCHFWLGRFDNQADVDAYLAETVPYPEGGPISKFAAEQGKCFYDHDFVFDEFSEAGDIAAILTTIRAPPDAREAVLAAAAALDFRCNTILAADEGEFLAPVSVAGPPRLEYIGCHELWGAKGDA